MAKLRDDETIAQQRICLLLWFLSRPAPSGSAFITRMAPNARVFLSKRYKRQRRWLQQTLQRPQR
jgi:hypothetical protein